MERSDGDAEATRVGRSTATESERASAIISYCTATQPASNPIHQISTKRGSSMSSHPLPPLLSSPSIFLSLRRSLSSLILLLFSEFIKYSSTSQPTTQICHYANQRWRDGAHPCNTISDFTLLVASVLGGC